MLQDHTFRQTTKDSRYWSCSRRTITRCQARIRFNDAKEISFLNLSHNHPPPKYKPSQDGKLVRLIMKFLDFLYEFIELATAKKPLLMVQGETFRMTTNDKRYWSCSKRNMTKCQARVRFNEAEVVVFYNLDHNHPPSKFYKTANGTYIKYS
ncbi:uncharacterized protein LOC134655207 [Cydia amplana]|uniref:uncharacterized protein LOC134655207 n=1 Tax=Cydia amplana TaxID=1869771 RepID=UPI002FE64BC5